MQLLILTHSTARPLMPAFTSIQLLWTQLQHQLVMFQPIRIKSPISLMEPLILMQWILVKCYQDNNSLLLFQLISLRALQPPKRSSCQPSINPLNLLTIVISLLITHLLVYSRLHQEGSITFAFNFKQLMYQELMNLYKLLLKTMLTIQLSHPLFRIEHPH